METNKKTSSQSQIEAAIELYHQQKWDCAITLAAAGEGILPPTDDPHLFQALQPHNQELNLNGIINWLKHPTGPMNANIIEFEVIIAIARAITKFVAVYHQSCERFEAFLLRGFEAGHLPRLFR